MGLFNSLNISINISYSQIFVFIVFKVVSLEVPEGKEIYTTYGESVLSATKRTDLPWMKPHADIDETGLEATIEMWLCLLFQLLALFKQTRSGSPMDLE